VGSRDYTKYVYLTIALEKNGPTHLALLRDAEEIDTKQYPTVAALRLKDYYAGQSSARVASGEQRDVSAHRSNGHLAQHVVTKDEAMASANADAAVDEWA